MALGLGYGLPFAVKRPVQGFAEDVTLATNNALADAAQREVAGNCLTARAMQIMQDVQTQPSLLVVPQLYKAGVLYDQLPTTRTNFLPNNSMAGATGSVLPTTWSSGSIPAGITVSYSASGTAVATDGTAVNYIDVTVSGTAGASGFLNIRPNPSPSTIAAFVGQSWNTSVYLQLISGSVASISPTWQLQELNSSQTFLQGSNIGGLGFLVVGGQFDRYNVSRVLTESATAFVTCRWGHSFVSGTTYSYTIRIASPQLERLGVATPMIATSTGAVTRLNESTNVVGLPPDFTVSRNTTATRVTSSGLIDSVASGVPRIDWLGQSCPGLLVEASGQNLVQRSEDFANNYWSKVNCVANINQAVAPDGALTANKLIMNNGILPNAANQSGFNRSETITSGTYRFSVFAKAAEFTGFRVRENLANGTFLDVNLTNGAITNGDVTQFINPLAENYGNGWYRISWTSPTITSLTKYTIRVGSTGDGTSGIFVWGAQVEVGSIATTYIPTTTAAVSRAADVISASGALVSGLIGQTEGTMYAEVDVRSLGIARSFINVQDSSYASNAVRVESTASNQWRIQIRAATISVLDQTITSPTFTTGTYKIAVAYNNAANGVVFAVNGTIIYTNASALTMPSGMDRVHLGTRVITGAFDLFLNDRIRAAALYTTRLSNDQLAELTRL